MGAFSRAPSNHTAGSPLRLGAHAVEEIRAAAVAGLSTPSSPSRAGLLVCAADAAVVDGIQLVVRLFYFGNGSALSDEDLQAFRGATARVPSGRSSCGYFRTTYGSFRLTSDDFAIAESVQGCRLIVIAKPMEDGTCTLRLYRREPALGTWAVYDQFDAGMTLLPQPLSELAPNGSEPPARLPVPPPLLPASAHQHAAPPPSETLLRSSVRLSTVLLTVGLAAALLIGASAVWRLTSIRHSPSGQEGGMGLRVDVQGSLLHLSWDRDSQDVKAAKSARIIIQDGAFRREVDLAGPEIAAGSVAYPPITEKVRFEVELIDGRRTVSEHIWVLDGVRMATSANIAPSQTGSAKEVRPEPVRQTPPPRKPSVPVFSGQLSSATADRAATPLPASLPAQSVPQRTFVPPPASRFTETKPTPLEPPMVLSMHLQTPAISHILSAPPPPGSIPGPPPRNLVSPRGQVQQAIASQTVIPAKPVRQSIPRLAPAVLAPVRSALTVEVQVEIGADGHVTGAEVAKATPGTSRFIMDASVRAAREWLFQPATSGGHAVPSVHTVVFNFKPGQ